MRATPRSTFHRTGRLFGTAAACAGLLAAGLTVAHHGQPAMQSAASTLPKPAHVVIVMEENHSYADIINSNSDTAYFNSLASQGALMTSSFGVSHPSEPNYMALYYGSTDGLSSDNCPVNKGTTANLGSELKAAGDTFKGYSEGLPKAGSTACTSGEYARKHAPWVNFSNTSGTATNVPYTSFPSSANYANLPTVSFVIPNLLDDMHDGTIGAADTWLQTKLNAYAQWAKTNNSLLIVTWDEDDYTENNQVPTIIVGQHVIAGSKDTQSINHYNVLATVEAMYGLKALGSSSGATVISGIWN
jgi:acid phosphatase